MTGQNLPFALWLATGHVELWYACCAIGTAFAIVILPYLYGHRQFSRFDIPFVVVCAILFIPLPYVHEHMDTFTLGSALRLFGYAIACAQFVLFATAVFYVALTNGTVRRTTVMVALSIATLVTLAYTVNIASLV